MKIYAIVLLVLILTGTALARDETLLGGEIESGGYGALVVKFGHIKGEGGVFVGVQGGWIVSHTLVIGGGGYGLANNIRVEDGVCPRLGFGYGGLLLEYIIASDKLAHASLQALIGAGGVNYHGGECTEDDPTGDDNLFLVLEPGANLMVNLHNYVRIGIGAAYRYVDGVDYGDLSHSDLSGFTGQLIFKFGYF
jgi:hypothetical protein